MNKENEGHIHVYDNLYFENAICGFYFRKLS